MIKNYLIKKAKKDLVSVEWWNKRAINALKEEGIFVTFGVAPKGKKEGKECVSIARGAEQEIHKIEQRTRETVRFWEGLIVGAILAFFAESTAPLFTDFLRSL